MTAVRDAVVVEAVRTPVGRFGRALAEVRPDDLGAVVLEALVERFVHPHMEEGGRSSTESEVGW